MNTNPNEQPMPTPPPDPPEVPLPCTPVELTEAADYLLLMGSTSIQLLTAHASPRTRFHITTLLAARDFLERCGLLRRTPQP